MPLHFQFFKIRELGLPEKETFAKFALCILHVNSLMNVYSILKYFSHLGGPRIKLTAILCTHIFKRRYIGVFLDPVLACNLRCRMCFFSDEEQSASMRGQRITTNQIKKVSQILFSRCIKLQLGCSAEPTLFSNLPELILEAKRAHVPYISITTNGQLLTPSLLRKYAEAGLNEVTLSVHGFTSDTYQYLMKGAKWSKFMDALDAIKIVKTEFPKLNLRINFVANDINARELPMIWQVLDGLTPNILQIRPVQKLGNTDYNNFDLSLLKDEYPTIITPIKQRCRELGITCIAPTLQDLEKVTRTTPWMNKRLEELTYYYIAPDSSNHPGLDLSENSNDSFSSYHKREHTTSRLWHDILHGPHPESEYVKNTKKLNYHID